MELPRTDIETAMRHALDLAARGPAIGGNPQVGCVLLDASGAIVAEGWHHGAGTPHAEVDALSKLSRDQISPHQTAGAQLTNDPIIGAQLTNDPLTGNPIAYARGLTAVVTLEPCNHTGRTGPCVDALIAAGVGRVVYSLSDPNPVAGGGAERLAAAGIPTTGGVLADEVAEFLRPWLTSTRLRRPFVTLKWASTLDGRTAAADGTSQWITGTAARQRVHEQREANDAILVGTGTVFADDPSLTARGDAGELMEHQPIPVVIGERAIPADAQLHSHPAGLIETRSRDLPRILAGLFDRGIHRAFVEGGPGLATALVTADLVDEFAIYLAPALLGGDRLAVGDIGVGSMPDIKKLQITGVEQLGNDLLVHARPLRSATSPSALPSRAPSTSALPSNATSPSSEVQSTHTSTAPAGAKE